MGSDLPSALRDRLEAVLAGQSRHVLAERSARLTASYRTSGTARFTDWADLIAYAVGRMPATYAAVSAALQATLAWQTDWRPGSLLDLGSGPGTAIWAARERFGAIGSIVAVEKEPLMLELSEALEEGGAVERRRADLGAAGLALPRSDLTIAAYVLGELATERLPAAIDQAWAAASEVLLLVEPGTPAGARVIGVARARLLATGALPVAPCPNALACPMAASSWCHFAVRLARSQAHRQLKGAAVPFEDEKFAYLAVSRRPWPGMTRARIVAPPYVLKPEMRFTVCSEGQIREHKVPRRDRERFRAARKLGWGDGLNDSLDNARADVNGNRPR